MASQVRHHLRDTTMAAHQRLHHHPALAPLTSDTLTRPLYRNALGALHGLHAAADQALASRWPDRPRRAPLLAADLLSLGTDPATLPIADCLPAWVEEPALLGGRYVIDGSYFGVRSMLPNIRRTLGGSSNGLRFFTAEDFDGPGEWRQLLGWLERLTDAAALAQARESAAATFAGIALWLDRWQQDGPPGRDWS